MKLPEMRCAPRGIEANANRLTLRTPSLQLDASSALLSDEGHARATTAKGDRTSTSSEPFCLVPGVDGVKAQFAVIGAQAVFLRLLADLVQAEYKNGFRSRRMR
jgi:hypothetical protein